MDFLSYYGSNAVIGNWKLGLATIIPTLVSFIVIPLSKKKEITANSKYYKVLRENSELFQETIELQQEISSFNQSKNVKENLYKKMEESEKIPLQLSR